MRAHVRGACIDTAGNAISGVSVQVRDEGTINPIAATIYAADTGATTKANPFNVNSLGEYDFYLDAPARVDLFISGSGYTARTITVDVSEIGGGGGGSDVKASVRAATTADITLSGAQTIDGVAVIAGDRVLVKDQTTGANNGLYTVVDPGAWTRTDDANTSAEVTSGMLVPVTEGTVNGDSLWQLTTNDPITLATTALVFQRDVRVIPGAGSSGFTAGGIPFGDANAALNIDAASLSWDNTLKQLSISSANVTPFVVASSSTNATGVAISNTTSKNWLVRVAGSANVDGFVAGTFTIRNTTDSIDPLRITAAGAVSMPLGGVTVGGALLTVADNSYDLGAVAGTRFRTGYFATSVVAPTFTASTAISAPSITDSGLTSGRVPFASTGGLLADASTFTFSSGTLTLGTAVITPALNNGATGVKIGSATSDKLGFWNATPVVQTTGSTDVLAGLVTIGLRAASSNPPLDLGSGAIGSGTITLTDAANIVVNATTGTKIGTATTQKLGFWNATPVVQTTGSTDVLAGLVTIGLRAASSNPPLNLGTGAITAGATSLSGALTFSSDNSVDIGASGATRPRTAYLGTSLITGDGSAAAPSIAFASSTTTGYYRAAAGEIGVANAGSANGLWYADGLLVGTATKPASLLSLGTHKGFGVGTAFKAYGGLSGNASYLLQNAYFDGTNLKRSDGSNGMTCVALSGSAGLYSAASGTIDSNVTLLASVTWGNSAGAATVGFYGVTSVVRPAAYTQTYATATRTHANPTASSVVTTAATNTLPYGYTQAQADSLPVAINALIVDLANLKQVVNSMIDDRQGDGLAQ